MIGGQFSALYQPELNRLSQGHQTRRRAFGSELFPGGWNKIDGSYPRASAAVSRRAERSRQVVPPATLIS
jgi:hypothetical protein